MKRLSIKQTLLLLGLAFICIMAGACNKTNNEDNNNNNNITGTPEVVNIQHTECLSDDLRDNAMFGDSIIINYNNGVMHVDHYNFLVNCAFDTIAVTSTVSTDTIMITETESPMNANCMCPINNSFDVTNIPAGRYIVIISHLDEVLYQQTLTF